MKKTTGRPRCEDRGAMTQAEVAERLGVSRARIAQIEMRAIRKLHEARKALRQGERS